MNRKSLLIAVACSVATFLCACGGGGGGSKPTPTIPTISITTAPPSSLVVNGTASIGATVSNDSSNAGVDWTCMPAASCGSFSATHTASGAATVYSAPATAGAVTITADATAMPSVTASASVTVTAPAIAIAITTAPPTSLEINTTVSVEATVTNDSTNAGVDWTCTPTVLAALSTRPTQPVGQ